MSRLLQVVIALIGLAITGVLGLASGRSEALQARHTLIGLFTDTVSAARINCDAGLAQMAVAALQQLENLETDRLVLTPGDRKNQEERQALLANYQDYMAEVQGTIDSGACRSSSTSVASADEPATASAAPSAGSGAGAVLSAPPSVFAEVARNNIELRRYEQQIQQSQVRRADEVAAPAPADGQPAPAATDAEAPAQQRLAEPSGYYAVLATYGVDEPTTYDAERGVVAHFRRLRSSVDGANVQMFQTGATNSFVIVAASNGGSRIDARRQVANARARGWSPSALVQPARDWTACAQPERISRQVNCLSG